MLYKKILILFFVCISLSCSVQAEPGSILFNNGISEFQKGRYQDAIFWFTKLIEKEPFNAKAYKNRGVARLSLQKYDAAIENINSALNPAADINDVDSALGPAWHHKETYEKAMEDFQSALNLDPDLEGIHSNIGVAWYYERQYDKAVAAYTREIEKHPENYSAFFNRALSWVQLNAYDKALKDLDTVLSIKPNEYWAIAYQGDIHAERKNWKAARISYKAAMTADPAQQYARKKLSLIDAQATSDNEERQTEPGGESQNIQTTLKKQATPSSLERRNKKTSMKSHTALKYGSSVSATAIAPEISNTSPGEAAQALKATPEKLAYTIQLGAFLNRSNAEELIKALEKKNIIARALQIQDKRKREWTLVRTGFFPSAQAAVPTLETLKNKLKRDAVVRPVGQF